jgi:hypothetical protein
MLSTTLVQQPELGRARQGVVEAALGQRGARGDARGSRGQHPCEQPAEAGPSFFALQQVPRKCSKAFHREVLHGVTAAPEGPQVAQWLVQPLQELLPVLGLQTAVAVSRFAHVGQCLVRSACLLPLQQQISYEYSGDTRIQGSQNVGPFNCQNPLVPRHELAWPLLLSY